MNWDEIEKILSLDREDPLADGLAELFRRMLTEGRQRMADRDADWTHLSIWVSPFVDFPGLSATDHQGSVQVEFGPETNRRLRDSPVRFGLKSPAFAAELTNSDWTEQEMDLLALRLKLDVCEQIRALLTNQPHCDWWRDWQAARCFPLLVHLMSGTVDLKIGEPTMGPLPEYDRRLRAGEPTEDLESKDVKMLPGLVPYNVVLGSKASRKDGQ